MQGEPARFTERLTERDLERIALKRPVQLARRSVRRELKRRRFQANVLVLGSCLALAGLCWALLQILSRP